MLTKKVRVKPHFTANDVNSWDLTTAENNDERYEMREEVRGGNERETERRWEAVGGIRR